MNNASPFPAPDIPEELIALRRKYVSGLPGQLDAIEALFRNRSDGHWERETGETLHRMVHSLTGTAGTFGLHELSNAARQLEVLLASVIGATTPPTDWSWSDLESAMAQVNSASRRFRPLEPLPPVESLKTPPPASTLVHLVIDSTELAEQLGAEMKLKGFRVELFTNPAQFHAASLHSASEMPSAVVLDVSASSDTLSVSGAIQQLGLADHPAIPLIVGLQQGDLHTRVAVARAGARHSLSQPLDSERLIDAINSVTGGASERPWRVLLVDDEPMVLQAHAVYLRKAGMEVRTLVDPMQTLEEVGSFEPDVLVIDVYMPEVNGPEVAAALRQSNIRPHLAIVFLSAETDMTQQLVALDLGGDDFLIKPVQPRHLVAAVAARARRARQNQIVQDRLETTLYERQREHLALDEHAIVSMADAAGNITYANDLFCATSGYSREEVIGKNHRLIKSGEHAKDFYETLWTTITNGQVWKGEICNKRRDGSNFWVECTITPFLDAQGLPYQYVSIRTDISHIKATENALTMQRDMQRMISMTATRLMASPANLAKEAVKAALQASGEHLGADHAFLFRFSRDGESMKNTHLWTSPNARIDPDKVKRIQLQQFNWMRTWFLRDGMVVVPEVQLLPEKAGEEKAVLSENNVRALIAFPMLKNGQMAGFVGYTSLKPMPTWTPEVSELLSVLSEVISSALARQHAENALRESESRLSFLVSSSPATIYTCETRPPFALTYLSPNVRNLLGFEPEMFLEDPRFWGTRVHPEDRERTFAALPSLLKEGSHQHEYRFKTHDGGYKWVHAELLLIRDEAGVPVEAIGYSMDITQRKLIEQELFEFNQVLEQRVVEQTQHVIESERISRATLDAMSSRVVILDELGVILAANRAWQEFHRSEARGAPLIEGVNYLNYCERMCDAEVSAGVPIATGIRSVIAGDQQAFLLEYTSHLPGEQRWFVCRVEPFPGDGAVRVVVSHENITQMKLIERQQMRSQRLESLGTLAGGVAHDLNNSLAPILMGMGILQEQYPEEDKLISMINNSAKRGADMVRQLLAFAKGVDGERIALQPAHLVNELESLMRGSFPKSIEVEVDCHRTLPTVLGDATQLHQILLNLCVNARDAMPHGGKLCIAGKTVEIDAVYAQSMGDAKPGHYVCLEVSDTGDGIPPDILDRIFDPFFTTKSQEKGTGLGLSTVLGIVKGHGGFVQVYSIQGNGTTFKVYLPVAQGKAGSKNPVDSALPFRGQGETILFVDDEPAVREVGMAVLKRLNFLPLVAIDGEDGLIKAAENRGTIKAIITDMHMPHMDGLAFVHAVRRTLPNAPIILASGRVDDSVAKDFRALGVTARLDKPFTEVQLAEKLGALLTPAAVKG